MASAAPTQAVNPTAPKGTTPTIPFPIASRKMTRFSFTLGTTNLDSAASTPLSPVMIPAVGFLSHLNLEVTVNTGAATAGATFNADGPFNALGNIEFKTAAGNDIIVPVSGYTQYLLNKWGCQFAVAPMSDNRMGRQYSAAPTTTAAAHFFLQVPLELDAGSGYGSIPALASNRSYQLNITLAAISALFGGTLPAAASVTINGTAHYWSEPPAQTASGAMQATAPTGIGTVSQWQIEMPAVTPGDKLIKSNNVGNVIRTLIFVLRTAAGARTDADWPAISELYLDNEPMFYLTKTEWEDMMSKQYNFTAASKDVAQGLDTGVYVIPFHALAGGVAGDPANSRSQYLPTIDASQLQIRGTQFGANASTLQILTNSVIPTDAATLYAR